MSAAEQDRKRWLLEVARKYPAQFRVFLQERVKSAPIETLIELCGEGGGLSLIEDWKDFVLQMKGIERPAPVPTVFASEED